MKTTTTANKPASKTVVTSIEEGKQALNELSQAIVMRDSASSSITDLFEVFRKTRNEIGDLRNCVFAQAFAEALGGQTSPKTGKVYTAPTISNYLREMRKALKSGSALVLNSAQAETRAKAKAVKLTKDKAKHVESDSDIADIPSAPTIAERTQSQKLYAALNTSLLIAQSDPSPPYNAVTMTKGLLALIALIPA